MAMNIIIEKYDARYWEEISQIHDEARKIELGHASLMDAFRPLEEVVVEEGLFEYKHVDVALLDGQVMGFCAYSEDELAWLYVMPEKMRNGIGRQLVAHALDTEKSINYIEVLFGNEPAKRLYESFGFEEKEIISGKMPGNERFRVKVYGMYRDIPRQYKGLN